MHVSPTLRILITVKEAVCTFNVEALFRITKDLKNVVQPLLVVAKESIKLFASSDLPADWNQLWSSPRAPYKSIQKWLQVLVQIHLPRLALVCHAEQDLDELGSGNQSICGQVAFFFTIGGFQKCFLQSSFGQLTNISRQVFVLVHHDILEYSGL